jgi:beta-glucanase (GH16 family)
MALLLGVLPTAGGAWAQQGGRIRYDDWKLETAEEFNAPLDTTALGHRWRYMFPWGHTLLANLETQYYTSQGVLGGPGVLKLTARRLAQPIEYGGKTMRYTSGMLFSQHFVPDSLTQRGCNPGQEGYSYGLFEIRCRQPRDDDSFPAFWLYGGSPDEIDVFEASPYHFSSTFHIRAGGYWRPARAETEHCSCYYYDRDPDGNLSQQFHTYGVAWLPNEVTFYFDGVPIRHETRYVPAGCNMSVLANLAIWNWARSTSDTLAIDYIRVYSPRTLPIAPAGARPGGEYPQSELVWLPFEQQPGRFDQANYQRWTVTQRPNARLALELIDNYNPVCNLTLPLPVGGHWAPSWVQTAGTPELQVQLPAGPDSLHWSVQDQFGRELARGRETAGSLWRPAWGEVPPGTYHLQLRQGRATATQPLLLLGRPPGSGPTAEWRQPAPPPRLD